MTKFNEMSRDNLIQAWIEAQTDAAAAKEREMQLRKAVAEKCFPDQQAARTQNLELGNGYLLKLESTVTHKLDKLKVDDVLTKIEKTFENGKFVVERLVKFDPVLSVGEYNKLDPKIKRLFDTVVTTTPAAPKLTFIEPKAKD